MRSNNRRSGCSNQFLCTSAKYSEPYCSSWRSESRLVKQCWQAGQRNSWMSSNPPSGRLRARQTVQGKVSHVAEMALCCCDLDWESMMGLADLEIRTFGPREL